MATLTPRVYTELALHLATNCIPDDTITVPLDLAVALGVVNVQNRKQPKVEAYELPAAEVIAYALAALRFVGEVPVTLDDRPW